MSLRGPRPSCRILLALSLCSGLLGACKAGEPRATPSVEDPLAGRDTSPPLPADPRTQLIQLPNGVRFLSQPISADLPRVVLTLYVTVGSLVEEEDERGLAHFVEHMAFNGTEHFPRHELVRFLEQAGLVQGADTLAQTGFRSTSYRMELPADSESLDRGVLILADWASGIRFDPVAVEQERKVVLAEKRRRDGWQGRLQQRHQDRWMRGSRFLERRPIGIDSVLASATPERLERFYRRWYQPQNLIVVALGQFEPDSMRSRVEQQFGALKRTDQARLVPQFEVPIAAGDQVAVELDAELPSLTVEVGLKRRSLGLQNEWDLRRGVLDQLLIILLQRRMQALPVQPGAALLHADAALGWGEVGMYDSIRLWATSAGPPEQALALLLSELERTAQHGFGARELERARASLEQRWDAEWGQRSGLQGQALSMAEALAHGDVALDLREEQRLRRRLLAASGWRT
jgi:zinc protease